MVRWFLAPILAWALISVTGLAGADAQQPDQVRITAVDTQAYPRMRTFVTVLDGSGRPVAGLDSKAFKVAADGKPVPVMGFTTGLDQNVPAAVVLAFDTSGSMDGTPIEQARQAGKTLVGQLGPTDQVAVLTFSNTVQLAQDFTTDPGALASAIDGISAAGNTALYDGVGAAVSTAARATGQRRAIVLLSDGKDEGAVSHSDRGSSLAAAQPAGIPFFVVGLGQSIDQAYLQDLGNVTRGQLFLAPSPEVLQGLYETIGTTLRRQYILDLDASVLDPASTKTLRVEVNHAGTVTAGETSLDLSPFAPSPVATPQVTPPTTPAATAVATPAGNGAEGGGSTFPLAEAGGLFVALGLAGIGGAVYLLRRRRQAIPQELRAPWRPGERDSGAVFVGTGPLGNLRADAWLESVAPENPGRFPLGEDPVTVGFTGDCTICLPDGAGQVGARFRVWRREGVYMLHNLSRLGKVTVGGKPATWAVLEDGDEIVIGASRLRFRMGSQNSVA